MFTRNSTVTTMTSPRETIRCGSYSLELPEEKPPPWSQTMTGLGERFADVTGAVMLRKRQSSFVLLLGRPATPWAAATPGLIASRIPDQGLAGFGAAHRSTPTGGAA